MTHAQNGFCMVEFRCPFCFNFTFFHAASVCFWCWRCNSVNTWLGHWNHGNMCVSWRLCETKRRRLVDCAYSHTTKRNLLLKNLFNRKTWDLNNNDENVLILIWFIWLSCFLVPMCICKNGEKIICYTGWFAKCWMVYVYKETTVVICIWRTWRFVASYVKRLKWL